jgi:hypothetical protein
MSLLESINQAKDFGVWLHERTNDRKRSGGVRERTGESILQLSLDLADAILLLLEARLPGPALTLGRPLFESYARGFWLLRFASDEEIVEFNNGQAPGMDKLLRAIGNDPATGSAWIHANEKTNRRDFNDLTHGGSEHVRRRNTQDAVEPNYPERELEALVRFGIEVRIRIGFDVLSLMNDEIVKGQLTEKAKNLRLSL